MNKRSMTAHIINENVVLNERGRRLLSECRSKLKFVPAKTTLSSYKNEQLMARLDKLKEVSQFILKLK